MIKVGIIGANGYTGYELMRLLSYHPSAKVVSASSRSNAGTPVAALYPSLGGAYGNMQYCEPDAQRQAEECDIIFTALPHGLSAETGAKVLALGKKVIDLSADFRYDSLTLFEKTYGIKHPCPQINKEAVYGLPELFRDKIASAQIIANPGCYTTASILALYPLLKEKLIAPENIIINAASGQSGAGRQSSDAYTVCESGGNFKAYAIGTHRHTSEIIEKLSAAGAPVSLTFTPHLLPLSRGILATIYVPLIDPGKAYATYEEYYKNEPFVRFGEIPELKSVVGSNLCRIGVAVDNFGKKLVIVSALDNLIKGAAGQAIQNMNILFGLDETAGLPIIGNQL